MKRGRRKILRDIMHEALADAHKYPTLFTMREKQVMEMYLGCDTVREASEILGIATRTFYETIWRIQAKMGLETPMNQWASRQTRVMRLRAGAERRIFETQGRVLK